MGTRKDWDSLHPCVLVLAVGAPRSATITVVISGLTPLKVWDTDLECEIHALYCTADITELTKLF